MQSEAVEPSRSERVFSLDPDSLLSENQRLQGDLHQSLAERNRLLKKLKEASSVGRSKGGSRILEKRLTDTRSRLAEVQRENIQLLEALDFTRDRLEHAERVPVAVIERIDEMLSMLTGMEQRPRRPNPDAEQLRDQLNGSLESLWRALRSNGAFEYTSLKKEMEDLTLALDGKRDEMIALARDKEAVEKKLAEAEESIKQLMSNNALRDSRLSALQNRVVDLEEESRRLVRSNRKLKGQVKGLNGTVGAGGAGHILGNGDMAEIAQVSGTDRQFSVKALFSGFLSLALGGLLGVLFMWLYVSTWERGAAQGPISVDRVLSHQEVTVRRDARVVPVVPGKPSSHLPKPIQDSLADAGLGPEMLPMEGGEFVMGTDRYSASAIEKPARRVRIKPFLMARHEVSFAQYDIFARSTSRALPDDQGRGRGSLPVVNVTWEDARAYAQWLSVRSGHSYRLPTEAEWEFAVAGGAQTLFWWGTEPRKGMEICLDCGTRWDGMSTGPVGSAETNPLGLFDMGGNAMEWVADCMEAETISWLTDEGCATRVVRGGAFDKPMQAMRTTARRGLSGRTGYPTVGFRLVREFR